MTTSSAFDPDTFMSSSTTEQGSTSFTPIPNGDYTAVIEDVSKPRSAGDAVVMDVTFKIMNPPQAVLDAVGRTTLTVKRGYFLDLTPDNRLDMGKGKNVGLNQLREALGQNKAGVVWSPLLLRGAGPVKIQVSQRAAKGSDQVFNDVKSVGKMA